MIKELIHDPVFLAGKSEVATREDLQVVQDLLDTLMAHRESCVGMAATGFEGPFNFEASAKSIPTSLRETYAKYLLGTASELMAMME